MINSELQKFIESKLNIDTLGVNISGDFKTRSFKDIYFIDYIGESINDNITFVYYDVKKRDKDFAMC